MSSEVKKNLETKWIVSMLQGLINNGTTNTSIMVDTKFQSIVDAVISKEDYMKLSKENQSIILDKIAKQIISNNNLFSSSVI